MKVVGKNILSVNISMVLATSFSSIEEVLALKNKLEPRNTVSVKKVPENLLTWKNLISNFSFDASLTMYTNKTINPPRKIKNKIKENHLVLKIIHMSKQVVNVCIKIKIKMEIGWDEINNNDEVKI